MRYLPLNVLLCGICVLHALNAQTPTNSYNGPIHAKLLKYISVRHAQPGSLVFVSVTADWAGPNCTLRKGAIIEAKVETAIRHIKGRKESELALSFSKAQCSGNEMASLDLILAAVSYVSSDSNNNGGQFPVVRYMSSPGIHTMGPGAIAGGNLPSTDATDGETLFTKGDEFRAMSQSAREPTLKVGEVYGIKGVKMQIDAGPRHSSLLTAKSHDIALDEDTQFLLVPTSLAHDLPPSSSPANSSTAAAPLKTSDTASLLSAAPAPDEEFEPCTPPSCTTDLPSSTEQVPGHPVEAIPLRPLGYAPRPQEVIRQLNYEDALAWLAPDRLLVAFNPHRLIYRDGTTGADAPLRAIRAVLLDTAQQRVVSIANWELSDSGKYLWQISGNRILVHVGNELRVYDAQLQPLKRLPLPGPLEFVRTSPNGKIFAAAVLKERHTPELHARLRQNLGHDPQEDVDVMVLDGEFKLLARVTTTSDIMPPTLLDEGQVTLLAQPGHRYRLSLLTWEKQPKTLAGFYSACTPDMSTLSPDLLFIRTCEKTYGAPEIRILRANGQMVMHGKPELGELGYEAKGDLASQTFVLKALHKSSALPQDAEFRGSDLDAMELRVYRAANGKRLSTIRTETPAPSHDGYCLSPGGTQIAVLAGGEVRIFRIPD